MKTKSIFALLLFIAASCSNEYNVSGKIEGVDNDTLYVILEQRDSLGNPVNEGVGAISVVMKNGRFKFKADVDYFTTGYIYPASGPLKVKNSNSYGGYMSEYIDFFLERGERVEIDAKFDGKVFEYSMSGSPLNEKYSEYRSTLFEFQRKRVDALSEIKRLREAGESPDAGRAMLKIAMDSLNKHRDMFIENNPDSPLAAYFLMLYNYDDPEMLSANKTKFKPEVFDSPLLIEYVNILKFIESNPGFKEKEQNRRRAFYDLKGKVAPDFSLISYNGDLFSLSSVKGRYSVVKFWGSWCSGCLESMPEFIEMAQKYAGEINFITIACKESETAWKNAVKKFKMESLINLIDSKDEVSALYNISLYPSYILIAPDGKATPLDYLNFKELPFSR